MSTPECGSATRVQLCAAGRAITRPAHCFRGWTTFPPLSAIDVAAPTANGVVTLARAPAPGRAAARRLSAPPPVRPLTAIATAAATARTPVAISACRLRWRRRASLISASTSTSLRGACGAGRVGGCVTVGISGEPFDHPDQLVAVVALRPREPQQLAGACHDGAALGSPGDCDAAAAPELE